MGALQEFAAQAFSVIDYGTATGIGSPPLGVSLGDALPGPHFGSTRLWTLPLPRSIRPHWHVLYECGRALNHVGGRELTSATGGYKVWAYEEGRVHCDLNLV